MTYALSWIADVLRAGGCSVNETDTLVGDWKNRGHGEFGTPKGILLHDTVGRLEPYDHPSLRVCIEGREPTPQEPNGLPGPLPNLYLSRSGVFYPVAAGIGYHAGPGSYKGLTNGNAHLIGIEMENDGVKEPWLPPIMQAAHTGVVALLRHIGVGPEWCIGHKEWAPHRKVDPDFPMPEFRASLAPYFT